MLLLNLLLTILIEFFILLIIFKRDVKKILFFCILINLFSWPLANLFYSFYSNFLIIELGVVVAESFLIMVLFKVKYFKGLLVSLVANMISAGAGLLVYWV